MKNWSYLILLCLGLLACRNEQPTQADKETLPDTKGQTDYTIYPGQGFGKINGDLQQSDLTRLLGDDQVVKSEFYIGEGEFAPGLALYPDSPEEIEVLIDEDGEILAYRIEIPNSKWVTKDGLKIGSSIADLEKANGRPFKLTGFDWDYGGTVISWEDGYFQDKDFSVRLTYNSDLSFDEEDISKIMGDQSIMSSEPALKKYQVHIDRIAQHYLLDSFE